MGMTAGGGGGLNSDINVTPLVDVVLVLLIIFMVINPAVPRGYDIDIPRESNVITPPDTDNKMVILAINAELCDATTPLGGAGLPRNCNVRINKENVALADLPKRMADLLKNRSAAEKVLFFAAEEKLNYEAVVQILDLARSGAGEDLKVAIVTDEKIATGAAGSL
jgi:biopolymer transport protein TolR